MALDNSLGTGMAQTDQEIAKAIAGLEGLVEQLQSGDLKFLFARAGDAEWSDGAAQMTRYYHQLLSLLNAIRDERAKLRKLKLQRLKKRRLKQAAVAKAASRRSV